MMTGTFMEISVIFLIVIIHELGHYTVAKWYNWRIRKISLWVFGGVMETDEHGSKPIKQELLIAIAGPLQHIWIYGLLFFCSTYGILPESVIAVALKYNTTILIFNLLPVWPLDGGKMLMLLYSSLLPYRQAHSLTIISSSMFAFISLVIFLLFYPFTLSTILLVGFILWENRLEWKRRYYTFIRFLLKRHRDPLLTKKVRPIVVDHHTPLPHIFGRFRRNCQHTIYVKDNRFSNLVEEKHCLHAYFNLKQYYATAGEVSSARDWRN